MRSPVDQLDGYLLRVLCMLMDERSVSRAARRLELAQPAVSAALKRLRELFGDPLLVREKLDMVPTARALELGAQARIALDAMQRLVASPEAFDAGVAARTFRVASPDYLAPAFLANLARRLRDEAPLCRLEVHPMGPDFDSERTLADDKLDVIIGNWPAPPERLHLSLLLEDELVCLVRRGHPLAAAPLTAAAYLAASHLVPMRYSSVQRGVVETHLASLKLTRDARVVMPYFAFAPLRGGADRPGVHDRPALRAGLHVAAAGDAAGRAAGLSDDALLPALARARPPCAGAPLAAWPDRRGGAGAGACVSGIAAARMQ